jgi:hypothetical protein
MVYGVSPVPLSGRYLAMRRFIHKRRKTHLCCIHTISSSVSGNNDALSSGGPTKTSATFIRYVLLPSCKTGGQLTFSAKTALEKRKNAQPKIITLLHDIVIPFGVFGAGEFSC